jgi:hypothetical protein
MAPSRHSFETTGFNADMKPIETYASRQFLVMSSQLKGGHGIFLGSSGLGIRFGETKSPYGNRPYKALLSRRAT